METARVDRTAYTVEDQVRMSRAENYFAWQSRLIHAELGRRIVEVGCGVGNFTGTLLDRDLVLAVDVEPRCIERLEDRYPGHPNLHCVVCDVDSSRFRALARFQPDTCVCLNVLEHTPDDDAAAGAMAAVLAPGGAIVFLLPAFPSLYGPIDRNLGHYRRYRKADVRRLADRAGLRLRRLRYFNFPGFFGWWINARLLRRQAQSEGQIRVFDRYLVPPVAALERALPPPFGQSLFAVLEKP
ncbi:MAG: methyltransferase domain-containing protein [Acidobacteriota bacterium]|nr:methyltransferase domain-containing protein [Acidobacteriota bacterium]